MNAYIYLQFVKWLILVFQLFNLMYSFLFIHLFIYMYLNVYFGQNIIVCFIGYQRDITISLPYWPAF